jgi:hypothetical protein
LKRAREQIAGRRSNMMAKRTPPPGTRPQPSLPHDHNRAGSQPYAKEVEDYGQGVANRPEQQGGRSANRRTSQTPTTK